MKRFTAKLEEIGKKLAEDIHWQRFLIGLLTYSIAVIILLISSLPSSNRILVGKPAPWDIKANHTVQIIDETRWKKAKEDAAAQVKEIETTSSQPLEISRAKLEQTFNIVRTYQKNVKSKKFTEDQIAEVAEKVPLDLSNELVEELLKSNDLDLDRFYTNSDHILTIVMNQGVREDNLPQAQERIKQEAAALPGISERNLSINVGLAQAALIPNKFIDYVATQQARKEASDKVEPITKTILPGQIIVREGDIVGESDVPALEAMGLYSFHITTQTVLTDCFTVLILIIIARQYLVFYLQKVYNNMRMLLGTALLCSMFMIISHYTVNFSPYLVPIAFTSMLISMLIDAKLSILTVSLLAIYTGVMTSNLASVCMVIITGLISILSVQNVNKRWDVVTASLWIWFINVSTILFIFSYNEQTNIQELIFYALFFGALNGLLPALIASGALPLLENVFKVTTHMRMLELSNPNEPALSDLLREAPGTYMHSIMVANLAEAAAQAIGADAMLCRAGACYHDIGKIKQPNMFVENQNGQENPHDKLPPTLSAMIITSHVSFGLELAAKYKLPPDIVNFIREHHGTNLASFFYQKAKQQEDNEPVFVEDFSYPGPRPQSKETAIVMICDGIEAASRTLAVPNKENLQKLIDGMVNNIIKNKQLDECPISIREINEVKASVLRSLTNHYHSRIAYPSNKTVKK